MDKTVQRLIVIYVNHFRIINLVLQVIFAQYKIVLKLEIVLFLFALTVKIRIYVLIAVIPHHAA